jgi:hypothetical protein
MALMSGAAVGALVAVHLSAWSPALLIVPLLLVIAVSSRMAEKPCIEVSIAE